MEEFHSIMWRWWSSVIDIPFEGVIGNIKRVAIMKPIATTLVLQMRLLYERANL